LQEGRENANIDAGLGFIWRISVKAARAVDRLVSAPLKRAIKGLLFSGHLQRAIKRSEFALELLRLVRPYGHEHFFPLLRQLGFAPRHIVDVGANRGTWTRAAFKYFRDPVYTLVEPQDHLRSYSQDLVAQGCKLNWINAGCSNFCGTLPLIVSYRDDASTFVDQHGNSTGSQRVPMITLNKLVASSGAGLPEMVKIDAEGFDLKVLAGASDLLGKTDIFLVEAAVCGAGGAYENSVAEVVRFMAKAGYNLMDITDLNRSPKHGVLWLCELAFLREGSPLLDATSYD
jgi:FkbM family methyltransferase